MSAVTTLIGNTTADVELRYSQAGKPIGSVTIAVSERKKNQQGDWEDGDVWFARGTIFGPMAETAAGSIPKGTRVIASGRIRQESWNDREGNPRTSVGVIIDEIGPSLRYASATVVRTSGTGGSPAQTDANVGAWSTPDDSTPF